MQEFYCSKNIPVGRPPTCPKKKQKPAAHLLLSFTYGQGGEGLVLRCSVPRTRVIDWFWAEKEEEEEEERRNQLTDSTGGEQNATRVL